MILDDGFGDRQTKAGAGNRGGMRVGGPEKPGEGLLQFLFAHACPCIGDFAVELMPGRSDRNGDGTSSVRAVDGIRDEVIDCLAEAHRLIYRGKVGLEPAREILRGNGQLVPQVHQLLAFIETQQDGKLGRGREALRGKPTVATPDTPEPGSPRIRRAA